MCQKKKRRNIQRSSPAAKTVQQNVKLLKTIKKRAEISGTKKLIKKPAFSHQSVKPLKIIKKRAEISGTTKVIKKPAFSHQDSKTVQTIKKRTRIAKTTTVVKKAAFSHQKKHITQTIKKRSTEPIRTARNPKQQRLPSQKNQVEQKKKQTEINTNRNFKQPKLLPSIIETDKDGGHSLTAISTSIASSMAKRTETDEESRYVPQPTQNSITPSVHQKKPITQTIKKRSTEPIKTARNSKQQRLPNQKNQLEQEKKKQTEINTNRNFKHPRLLHRKKNPNKISNNRKKRSKTVRNAKTSTQVISKSTTTEDGSCIPLETSTCSSVPPPPSIIETDKDGGRSLTGIFTSITSSMATRTETDEESRYVPQATQTFITPSVDPEMRILKPSTAVAPASLTPENRSCSKNINATGFDRNLEASKIIHMVKLHKQLFFMMSWKGSTAMDLVPIKTANERCPQLVIQFYESRLRNVFRSNN